MDERTLREIYLPAFKAAVQEAGVLAVMGAYNEFRGQHCAENDYLLNKILKGEWGFKGAGRCPIGAAFMTRARPRFNGLDLEMGTENRSTMITIWPSRFWTASNPANTPCPCWTIRCAGTCG